MKIRSQTVLAIAAVLITLPYPILAQAGNAQPNPSSPGISTPSSEAQEASKMVPALATFATVIESQKMQPGSQFHARLSQKVHLDNGPELPAGTILDGQVVRDNSRSTAKSRLAIRFTEADLKGGHTVPIKATIVNVYKVPSQSEASDYSTPAELLDWNDKTAGVDQIDAISGVDLHSRIASLNSGVFVSNSKADIKLSPNVGMELAIAARG